MKNDSFVTTPIWRLNSSILNIVKTMCNPRPKTKNIVNKLFPYKRVVLKRLGSVTGNVSQVKPFIYCFYKNRSTHDKKTVFFVSCDSNVSRQMIYPKTKVNLW